MENWSLSLDCLITLIFLGCVLVVLLLYSLLIVLPTTMLGWVGRHSVSMFRRKPSISPREDRTGF